MPKWQNFAKSGHTGRVKSGKNVWFGMSRRRPNDADKGRKERRKKRNLSKEMTDKERLKSICVSLLTLPRLSLLLLLSYFTLYLSLSTPVAPGYFLC